MSVRIVAARHDACGHSTRVRLPSAVPARAVHRLRCDHCERSFEIGEVDDFGLESELTSLEAAVPAKRARKRGAIALPKVSVPKRSRQRGSKPIAAKPKATAAKVAKPKAAKPKPSGSKISKPKLPKVDAESRWRLATIPVAALLVIGGLVLIQGGGSDDPAAPTAAAPDNSPPSVVDGDDLSSIPPATAGDPTDSPTSPDGTPATNQPTGGSDAHLVSGTTYSLALPKGWEETTPPSGATFAAAAPGGEADATLWVTRDPKLEFPTFVQQSLAQLEALAGSAHIVERVPAPTAEGTIVRLAADAPEGEPSYTVTLRVAGPYRYYLGTTLQPDASPQAAESVELVEGSFTPEAKG